MPDGDICSIPECVVALVLTIYLNRWRLLLNMPLAL